MNMTKEQIEQIAKLARLRPSDEQMSEYVKQIGSILEYVDRLQELDTKEGGELAHAAHLENVLRTDEVQNCDEQTRKNIIDSFPQKEGDLLKVQAVFEAREDQS